MKSVSLPLLLLALLFCGCLGARSARTARTDDTWHVVATDDWVTISVERALYRKPGSHRDFFMHVAIFNAGTYERGTVVDTDPAQFERCWRVGAFGGFLVGRAAARHMLPAGEGTILFTGATASLRGGAGFVNLASPKFALRAVAQSMARELGPKGIHVAHVVIDGQIRSAEGEADAYLDPRTIAEAYVALHRQPRNAWTQELDLRPWSEKF